MPDFGTPFSGLDLDRKLTKEELIRGLRFSVSAEFEAIQLYNQLANASNDEDIKKALNDIADEEIVHAGEFLALIKRLSPEEDKLYQEGVKETEDLIGKKSFDIAVQGIKIYKSVKALDKIAGEIEKQNPLCTLLLDRISDRLENNYGLKINS